MCVGQACPLAMSVKREREREIQIERKKETHKASRQNGGLRKLCSFSSSSSSSGLVIAVPAFSKDSIFLKLPTAAK